MLTFTTPSVGATKTPSVRIDKDVRTACSKAFSRPNSDFNFPASSFAINKAVDSLSFSSATSLIRGAIPSGPTCASTLSAKSLALGISGESEGSKPAFLTFSTNV